jgi:hypothetical protein
MGRPRIYANRAEQQRAYRRRLEPFVPRQGTLKLTVDRVYPKGSVYFVQCGVMVKIGFTTHLERRLTQIRIHCPAPIVLLGILPGTQQNEQALHQRFALHRSHGEWFQLCEDITTYLSEAQEIFMLAGDAWSATQNS